MTKSEHLSNREDTLNRCQKASSPTTKVRVDHNQPAPSCTRAQPRAHAAGRSWPADLANDYLGARIVYDLDDGAMDGLRMFYEKAGDHGLAEYARTIKLF